MIRRRILLAAPLAMAACQSAVPPLTQLQTTSALVTAGVSAVAASVLSTPNLAPATSDKIKAALATVNAANQAIQGATVTTASNAQEIVAAVKIAVPLLLARLDPQSPEAIALNAAMALLPTVLAAAGVTATSAGPAAGMDPVRARLILQGYVGK